MTQITEAIYTHGVLKPTAELVSANSSAYASLSKLSTSRARTAQRLWIG